MRFGKTIKKAIALGTGLTMLSGAMAAADLSQYPSPFIKDGKFTGVMVVGDKAAAEDVIGVSDIAISLQFSATTAAGTTTSGTSVEGDAWKVGTSTKILELGENVGSGASNREVLKNITSRITSTELDALASGEASNTKGDAPYSQYLYLLGPNTNVDTGYVTFVEDQDDVTADFLYFQSGQQIGRYLLDFTTALESDVDDSSGSALTTGLYLTDLEDVDIAMFGKTYTIVQARRNAAAGNGVKLTLMGGAVKDTLLEGETKTYTVEGKDFETTLDFVSSTQTKFTINGEATRLMRDGDTDKLSDGTEVGVSEILYQDYAGGIHSTTFYLGAQKLELKDTTITNGVAYSNNLKVGDETIDNAFVAIEGTDDNTTFKLERININMTADDDFFVPVGGKLSENPELAEPQVLFTNQWDIEYHGLKDVETEEIKVTTSGSSKYKLEFIDGDGEKVSVALAKAVAASKLHVGDTDKALINEENKSIYKNDYIILTDSTENRGERGTYVLQYKGSDKVTADSKVLKFKNLGDGTTIEQSYSEPTALVTAIGDVGGELATLKLGGGDYKIYNASSIKSNDFQVYIDLDASGTVQGKHIVNATTKYGMEIGIHNQTDNGILISFMTPDNTNENNAKDAVETLQATTWVMNLTADSNTKVNLAQATAGAVSRDNPRLALISPEDEDNVDYGYTAYGTYIKWESPSSSPDILTIEYPKEQREAIVYITAKGATISSTSVTSGEAVVVNRIEVGATKLASEVPDVKAVNAILVGGPCANAAAAEIMDNPADCTAGFEAGKGLIKLFENDGNVAMLVAGYSATDTRAAAKVIANYGDYALEGTAREVTTATMAVTEVTEVVEEEVAEEEEEETTEE